jgi:FAD:protein FMN transferase
MKFKRIILQLAILIAVFVLVYTLSSDRKNNQYISFFGFTQGTSYHITYKSNKGEHLQSAIEKLLSDFDQSLSIYNPNSIISRFNRNDTNVVADDLFVSVFNKSFEVYKKTNGAFDITVGPIVNALGFGSKEDTMNVDTAMIINLRKYVGMNKVKLQNKRLIKADTNIVLDVNAIAQGYSVDLVADFLESKNIHNYLVEIGGEVRAKGKNERREVWKIGIDKPAEGNSIPGSSFQAILRLNNLSSATSGNYRQFYVKDGIKYVHTIDPKTGFPVISNLLSATVVAKDCITADAYATAFMVFGVDKTIAFLKENNFLNAYLIYTDEKGYFKTYMTPQLKQIIEE